MINTKQVTGRRRLRCETSEAVMRDAEALAVAERRGALRATGNWTLGQAVGHLAFSARAPFEGYPDLPQLSSAAAFVVAVVQEGLSQSRIARGISDSQPAGGRVRGRSDADRSRTRPVAIGVGSAFFGG